MSFRKVLPYLILVQLAAVLYTSDLLAAWPTGSVPTTNLDSASDSPAAARADLKTMADKVNPMISHGGAVTNYQRGHVAHIHDDAANSVIFDMDAVIGAAWESVGATGSGATNIWTALDDVPAGATYIIAKVVSQISGSTSGTTYVVTLYARIGGSSAVVTDVRKIHTRSFTNSLNAQEIFNGVTTVFIPIDSNGIFDLYMTSSGAGIGLNERLALIGWGE